MTDYRNLNAYMSGFDAPNDDGPEPVRDWRAVNDAAAKALHGDAPEPTLTDWITANLKRNAALYKFELSGWCYHCATFRTFKLIDGVWLCQFCHVSPFANSATSTSARWDAALTVPDEATLTDDERETIAATLKDIDEVGPMEELYSIGFIHHCVALLTIIDRLTGKGPRP